MSFCQFRSCTPQALPKKNRVSGEIPQFLGFLGHLVFCRFDGMTGPQKTHTQQTKPQQIFGRPGGSRKNYFEHLWATNWWNTPIPIQLPIRIPWIMMTMLCCFFRSLWERDSPLSGKITSLGYSSWDIGQILQSFPPTWKVPLQSQDPSSSLALCKFSSTRSVRLFWFLKKWLELNELVVSTHLKNRNLPQMGVKIKNLWNHHLVI